MTVHALLRLPFFMCSTAHLEIHRKLVTCSVLNLLAVLTILFLAELTEQFIKQLTN